MSGTSLYDDTALFPEGPYGRRSDRAAARRRRNRRRRTAASMVVALLVVAGIAAAAFFAVRPLYRSFMAPPPDYPGPGTGSVVVKIEAGSTGADIARDLAAAGVVKDAGTYVDVSREDSRSASVQAGTYRLKKEMSSAGALAALLDPKSKILARVTIPEGARVAQIVKILVDRGKFDPAKVNAALKNPAALGLPASARNNPEGYLFASTYDIEPDTQPADVLTAMVTRTREVLTTNNVPEARWHEVLTKASIVQAEGGAAENFGKVARVLDNRLGRKPPMKLQLDSTVSYATGRFGITTTAKDRANPSPYNTYVHPGLPAGPIDNPSEDAIAAVLAPEPGPWLFFVTVDPDTGETKFATTPAEHAANVAQFQAWLRAHGR
jgi:UPF0755 protein